MKPRILLLWIAVMVVAAPLAAGQSGPAPGYDDAVDYALDYAAGQVSAATADPVGYAGEKATPEGIEAEVAHAAYMACWAVDDLDAGVEDTAAPVCDPFYTPPGTVDPPQPADDAEDATQEAVENVTVAAEDLVNETTDAVQEILDDPASAPSRLQRIVGAVGTFVGAVVDIVVGLVTGVLHGLGIGVALMGHSVRLALAGFTLAGQGLMDMGVAIGSGLQAALQAAGTTVVHGMVAAASVLAQGVLVTVHGIVMAVQAVGVGITTATGAVGNAVATAGHAVAVAGSATGHAVAVAGSATGHAVADGVQAVGHAVSDVAHAIKDTVTGWFGTDAPGGNEGSGVLDDGGVDPDVDTGLVDGLLDQVKVAA